MTPCTACDFIGPELPWATAFLELHRAWHQPMLQLTAPLHTAMEWLADRIAR